MKKLQANCWISDDESWVQSYNTRVAEIDHVARTVTATGYWSSTTCKHIRTVARRFGYAVHKNARYDWEERPKRDHKPKPAFGKLMYSSNLKRMENSRQSISYDIRWGREHRAAESHMQWQAFVVQHTKRHS